MLKKKSTFTLVEVLITMTIVIITMGFMYTSMLTVKSFVVSARYRSEANRLAHDKAMEYFSYNMDYLSILLAGQDEGGITAEAIEAPTFKDSDDIQDGDIVLTPDFDKVNGMYFISLYEISEAGEVIGYRIDCEVKWVMYYFSIFDGGSLDLTPTANGTNKNVATQKATVYRYFAE